jgi:predicted Zn-dependent protease with MMP-like domain
LKSFSSQTYGRLSARRDALAVHFDLGLRAYDDGDMPTLKRHLAALAMLPEGGAESPEFMALKWRRLWLDGEREEALSLAQKAMRMNPDDVEACLEVAEILLEFDALESAAELLLDAAARHTDDPDIWYEAGLLFERLEHWELRQQCWERVWDLESGAQSLTPTWISEARFVEVAALAIEALPAYVRSALGNVVVFAEDYPERWIFEAQNPDPRMLGLFDGVGRDGEMATEVISDGPSRIYLYRWNIERRCLSADEVEREIRLTVQHEVGHYLGLDEDELHLRGLG